MCGSWWNVAAWWWRWRPPGRHLPPLFLHWRMEGTHLVIYCQPGKHAFVPDPYYFHR